MIAAVTISLVALFLAGQGCGMVTMCLLAYAPNWMITCAFIFTGVLGGLLILMIRYLLMRGL